MPVTLTEDFLQSLARKRPISGLIELIDNALDADSTHIAVEISRTAGGGPIAITIRDDGFGMDDSAIQEKFAPLGDSWKYRSKTGRNARVRRGRLGRGRFAAFALGRNVSWTTSAHDAVHSAGTTYLIKGYTQPDIHFDYVEVVRDVGLTDAGTVVRIETLSESTIRDVDSAQTRARLEQIYAPYLAREKSLTIIYDGQALNPARLQVQTANVPLTSQDLPDGSPDVVKIVRWDPKVDIPRAVLILASGEGDAILDLPGVRSAPFKYTAYLSCKLFEGHKDELMLGEHAEPPLGVVIDAATTAVNSWISAKVQQARGELITQWKDEQSYPYESGPTNAVESAERDLFDLVATTAAPALSGGDAPSRHLALALIREALRRDASEVADVLEQVLRLNTRDLSELRRLLDKTSLSDIIATAGLVADRIEVLEKLDQMTNFPRTRVNKLERPVHELAALNPWLFGDGWALAQSERGLTEVLKWHLAELGDEVSVEGPSVKVDNHVARVDVVLARSVENSSDSRERLVIEFKRPGLPIGSDQITQIEKYAQKITSEGRFTGQDIKWEFVLIGSSLDAFARGKISRGGYIRNHFGAEGQDVPVRVVSWDTLLMTCRHRLRFVSDVLNASAGREGAGSTLREAHELAFSKPSTAA